MEKSQVEAAEHEHSAHMLMIVFVNESKKEEIEATLIAMQGIT